MPPLTPARPGSARQVAPRRPARRRALGVSLVEALVAFLVLTVGMVVIARLQSTLRLNADVARQRTEGTRLAQEAVERSRAYVSLAASAGAMAYDDIASQAPTDVAGFVSNTTFSLLREVTESDNPDYKAVGIEVRWADRASEAQSARLDSIVARVDPAFAGLLSISTERGSRMRPMRRAVGIPPAARDLGDGRSAFRPFTNSPLVWVFNNTTGLVSSTCTVAAGVTNATITTADLTSCTTAQGLLIGGFVRFATDSDTLTSRDAEEPDSDALNLNLFLTLTGSPTPVYQCLDDSTPVVAASGETITYFCVVYPTTAPARWGGTLDIAPIIWLLGDGVPGRYKVCRYSADADGSGTIENDEHPLSYTDVDRSLFNQNFLVVRALAACPTDVAVDLSDPSDLNATDDSTVQHQPRP